MPNTDQTYVGIFKDRPNNTDHKAKSSARKKEGHYIKVGFTKK